MRLILRKILLRTLQYFLLLIFSPFISSNNLQFYKKTTSRSSDSTIGKTEAETRSIAGLKKVGIVFGSPVARWNHLLSLWCTPTPEQCLKTGEAGEINQSIINVIGIPRARAVYLFIFQFSSFDWFCKKCENRKNAFFRKVGETGKFPKTHAGQQKLLTGLVNPPHTLQK